MSNENKKKAEDRLIHLLKAEVEAVPIVVPGDSHEEEVVETNNNIGGLEAAFQALKKKARKDDAAEPRETAEGVVEDFFHSNLEKSNLSVWAKFEEKSQGFPIRLALCRLARKYLTPPATSTDSERLFSVAGQVFDEKRARMLPDSLEKILFLRENIIACSFNLDW